MADNRVMVSDWASSKLMGARLSREFPPDAAESVTGDTFAIGADFGDTCVIVRIKRDEKGRYCMAEWRLASREGGKANG